MPQPYPDRLPLVHNHTPAGACACSADIWHCRPRLRPAADTCTALRLLGTAAHSSRARSLLGAVLTAGLLASDALDVDDPLLPVALDNLALTPFVRATHNRDLIVLAHRHGPHLGITCREAENGAAAPVGLASAGTERLSSLSRLSRQRVLTPCLQAFQPLPRLPPRSSVWAAAHMVFVPQLR